MRGTVPRVRISRAPPLLATGGVSLYKLSLWLGHSHEEVTKLYAHLQDFDADIERFQLRAHAQGDAVDPALSRRIGHRRAASFDARTRS